MDEIKDIEQQTHKENGHDAFVRQKVEHALKSKKDGELTYKPLREVASKYDTSNAS